MFLEVGERERDGLNYAGGELQLRSEEEDAEGGIEYSAHRGAL